MAGTWPLARAAIKTHLDGLTLDLGSEFVVETLTAFEWAVPGRQDAENFPYAFILQSQLTTTPRAGGAWVTEAEPVVRVMVATPADGNANPEVLQRRYDGWVEAIRAALALDDAVTLDGNCDVWTSLQIGDLEPYDDIDVGWGFEVTITGVRITEVRTFSA